MKEMQKVIDQKKDLEITTFKSNLEALEIILKNVEKETGEIEARVLNESISALENSVRIPEKEIFRCEKCNFTTESERGLKVHTRRKHGIIEDIFPQACDFCEKQKWNRRTSKSTYI